MTRIQTSQERTAHSPRRRHCLLAWGCSAGMFTPPKPKSARSAGNHECHRSLCRGPTRNALALTGAGLKTRAKRTDQPRRLVRHSPRQHGPYLHHSCARAGAAGVSLRGMTVNSPLVARSLTRHQLSSGRILSALSVDRTPFPRDGVEVTSVLKTAPPRSMRGSIAGVGNLS